MNRLVVWHRWLPPREETETPVEGVREWIRTLSGRLRVMGGDVVGTLGAATAATFECSDAVDVVEMGLEILTEASVEGLAVSIAVTAGRFLEEDGLLVSEALERAQLLANRTRPGELVLGPGAKDLVGDAFLFGRRVNAGAGAPRGITIDREHAHRDDQSSIAIAELDAPSLPPTLELVATAANTALSEGHRSLAFRGPVGAGASEVIASLAAKRGGVPWRLAPALGGLVPLASLRAALLRRFDDPAGVRRAFEVADGDGVLGRVADGLLVPRATLTGVLRDILQAESEAGRTPWLVMSPLGQIDGATLEAVLPVHDEGRSVLAARLGLDAEVPRPLREAEAAPLELTLPPLKMADALKVAEGALGDATPPDVVRRVAVLGGDTVLGVLDVARALMASGDLVRAEGGFAWRKGPVEGAAAMDMHAILDARVEPLNDPARRILEALSVLPEGSSRPLIERVAAAHGVPASAFGEGMAALMQGALVRDETHPRPSSPWIRWRVLGRMDEARANALYDGVAAALDGEPGGVPTQLQRAYYLHEAGQDDAARALVEDAISNVVAADYHRAARQLMGWLESWAEPRPANADRFEPDEDGPPTREIPLAPIAGEGFEGDEDATSIGTVAAPQEAQDTAPPLSERPDPSLELDEDPTRVASLSDPAMRAALAAPGSTEGAGEEDALGDIEVDLEITAELDGLSQEDDRTSVGDRWLDDTDSGTSEPPRPPPLPSRPLAAPPDDSPPGSTPPPLPASTTTISRPPLPMRDAPEPFAAEMTMRHALEVAEPDDGKTRVGPLPTLAHGVRQALRARDFEALESLLCGAEPQTTAVQRVRALGKLLRGDLTGARAQLAEMRDEDVPTRTKATRALIELCAGDPALGVRTSLEALSAARANRDDRGEWVARHILAECLHAWGHPAEAERARPGDPR
ncbi:MAG: hypothetical protein AB8I08_24930 [Sandaracinaceae bacterium]